MSNDLISRSELKKEINELAIPIYGKMVLKAIDNAPTVEQKYYKRIIAQINPVIEERPQGEWIKEDDEHLKGWYRCSECGRRVEDLTDDVVVHAGCEDYTIADIYPYCHCGADMRGGRHDE